MTSLERYAPILGSGSLRFTTARLLEVYMYCMIGDLFTTQEIVFTTRVPKRDFFLTICRT